MRKLILFVQFALGAWAAVALAGADNGLAFFWGLCGGFAAVGLVVFDRVRQFRRLEFFRGEGRRGWWEDAERLRELGA